MLDFNARQAEQDDAGPDMISLLDAIFILLIFFIIAAAFSVRGMELDVPQAQSSHALSGKIIELRLLNNGSFILDGIPAPKNEVRQRLHTLVRSLQTQPAQLVLKADPAAPVEALVFLVDEVRLQGGEKLHIATTQPKDAGQ